MQDLQMLQDVARRWRSSKAMKHDLVVAITQHHCACLLKHYVRPPWTPSFVKSRTLHLLQTHFLLFQQQIFFVLVCVHLENARVRPQVLASGPKACGVTKDLAIFWLVYSALCCELRECSRLSIYLECILIDYHVSVLAAVVSFSQQ